MTTDPATERRTLFLRILEATATGVDAVHAFVRRPADAAEVARLLLPLAQAPHLEIRAVLVSGARVDIGVTSSSNREWAVVLSVPEEDPTTVTDISVFERPPPFAGVAGGFVVVRGPSSSGKSTLMSTFCDLADTPWFRFDDALLGEVPLRFRIWPEASGPLGEGFLAALPAIAREGNQIITITLGESQQRLYSLLAEVPTLFVRLECPVQVLIDRQRRRSDRWAGLAEESAGEADNWTYDLRMDTSSHSPEAAAALLLQRVAEAQRCL